MIDVFDIFFKSNSNINNHISVFFNVIIIFVFVLLHHYFLNLIYNELKIIISFDSHYSHY